MFFFSAVGLYVASKEAISESTAAHSIYIHSRRCVSAEYWKIISSRVRIQML